MGRSVKSTIAVGAFFVFASACSLAHSQSQKTLFIAGPGGTNEQILRSVFPSFEKEHQVKIEYVVGTTAQTLAKLQAQRNAQEIDLAIFDDGSAIAANNAGLCDPVRPDPSIDNLLKLGGDPKTMPFVIDAFVPIYNAKLFKDQNLPVPVSWKDFLSEKYTKQISFAHISTSAGVTGFVMIARALGGGESNMEPGFEAFSGPMRNNVVTFSPSAPRVEELLQREEISLTWMARTRIVALQQRGLPIEIAKVSEGYPTYMLKICPVVQSDVPDIAQAFVRHLASDEAQIAFARGGYTPVRDVKMPDDIVKSGVAPSAEFMKGIVQLDWATITKERNDWINRWNRRVER